MSSTGKRGEARCGIPRILTLVATGLAAVAAIPTGLIAGRDGLAMLGVGAGTALTVVLVGYGIVVAALRGPDRMAVQTVVGGFMVRMALLVLCLIGLSKIGLKLEAFVLWLIAFYVALVLAEAWVLARQGVTEEE